MKALCILSFALAGAGTALACGGVVLAYAKGLAGFMLLICCVALVGAGVAVGVKNEKG